MQFHRHDFDGLKIMVIGDQMLDRYLIGKIERQNPEGSAPLVKITSERTCYGGAQNVVRMLRNLGVKQESRLSENNDPLSYTLPTKIRVIAGGKQVLRIDEEEPNFPLDELFQKCLMAAIKKYVAVGMDALIIADYAKVMVGGSWLQRAAEILDGRPIFIDGHPSNYRLYPERALIKINERELREMTGESDIMNGIDVIKKDHHTVVVTCGESGTVYSSNNEPVKKIETVERKVYDVTGAGDIWMACFVPAFLLKGLNAAIEFANHVAGISVERIGSYCPSWEEIERGHADPENPDAQTGDQKGETKK